jgi:type II secretory pathway component PulF
MWITVIRIIVAVSIPIIRRVIIITIIRVVPSPSKAYSPRWPVITVVWVSPIITIPAIIWTIPVTISIAAIIVVYSYR